ncbi:hypothetical protein BJL95_08135 [Methylomonas sp. LWB]|nr:hypothetical protein BJL95_08135 [Methylomonas sp. LWB]
MTIRSTLNLLPRMTGFRSGWQRLIIRNGRVVVFSTTPRTDFLKDAAVLTGVSTGLICITHFKFLKKGISARIQRGKNG